MNDKAKVLTGEEIEVKILHLLTIYPIISPTMLQTVLGPPVKPAIWRPVLDKLVDEGKVIQEHEPAVTPAERYNNYPRLRLPGVKVVNE